MNKGAANNLFGADPSVPYVDENYLGLFSHK
jgi:hypothetical protein